MGLELGGAGSGEAGFGRVLLVFFSGNLFVGFCDCEGALRVLVRRGSGEEGVRILPGEPDFNTLKTLDCKEASMVKPFVSSSRSDWKYATPRL